MALTVAAISATVSPETSSSREKGNTATTITGTITQNNNSTYVALSAYKLQYNAGASWVDLGNTVLIGPGSTSVTSTRLVNDALFASTSIQFRAIVYDAYYNYLNSSYTSGTAATVSLYNMIWYGPLAAQPTTSADVRAMGTRQFIQSLSNPFNLTTGTTYKTFTVAMPATVSITNVIDLDALNADITASYVNSTFNVNDYAGTAVSYNVYTMSNASVYSSSHRHQITRA